MHILLIATNRATSPYAVYPVGMGMVAQVLGEAGHTVCCLDYLQIDLAAVREAVWRERPALIGVSMRNLDGAIWQSRSTFLEDVVDIVMCLRRGSEAPIVLGGSGFSVMPEQVLAATGADYGIVGEGERQIVALAAAIAAGEPPPKGCLRPDRHLEPEEMVRTSYDPSWLEAYGKQGGVVPVQTKRGCPYGCAYCSYPVLEGRRLRPRPPAMVVDEIERLVHEHGVPSIFFSDSVFNDAEGHYLELVAELKRRQLPVSWSAFLRPQGLSAADVAAMRESGLTHAELGTDATSDETLAGLGKGFTWREVMQQDALLAEHGVKCAHFVIFGGPGETQETVQLGLENLAQLLHTAVFAHMGVRVLPGTPIASRAVADGVLPADADLLQPHYYLSPGLDRESLEQTLLEGFARMPHGAFPPDRHDRFVELLHRQGHTGPLWERLIPDRKPLPSEA